MQVSIPQVRIPSLRVYSLSDSSPPRASKRPRIKLINTSPPKPVRDSPAMAPDATGLDLHSDAPLALIEPDETALDVDVLSSETQFLLTDAPLTNAMQEDGLALVPENGHAHPCNARTTYPLDVDNLIIITNSNHANSNNSVTATNNHYSSNNNNHTASNNNHQPVVHDLTGDAAADDMLDFFNNTRTQTRSRARFKPSPMEKDGLPRPHVRSKGAMSFRDTSAMILQSHVEEEEILAEVRERTGKSSTRERTKSSAARAPPPSPRERRKSGSFWKASGHDSSDEEEDSVREYSKKKKSSRKAAYKRSDSLSKHNSNHNNSSRKTTASNNNNNRAVYVNKPASKNGIRNHRTTADGASNENGRLRQSKLITEAVELAKNSTYSYERKITQYVPTPTPPIFEKRYNKAEREAYWYA